MNLERALKLIRVFKETKDYGNLNTLEEMIIKGITMKKVAETTSKTRYNRAKRVLARSKNRGTLQYTVERDNKQYFTDSFIVFEMTNKIPELPIIEDEKRYPSLNVILEQSKNTNSEITYNCKELKQMIKIADEYMKISLENYHSVAVNKNYLLDVLTILDYKNNEDIVIKYSYEYANNGWIVKPLVFEREDDTAVLLPIRVNGYTAEKLGVIKE